MLKERRLDAATKDFLRSARPRLIMLAGHITDEIITFEYLVRVKHIGWDEVIEECYDAMNGPMGFPVYWREVMRSNQKLCLGTFPVTAAFVVKYWGKKGLAYCDPDTRLGVARLEVDCTRRNS